MPLADALASIQSIQSRIDTLFGRPTPPRDPASTRTFDAVMSSAITDTSAPSLVSPITGVDASPRVTGNDVARAAARYEGVPYVLGGTDETGIDCSGLVQRAYADVGIEVPRLVRHQEDIGVEVPSLAEARPGDLVVSEGGDHIGIWMGDGKIIHAPYEGRTVSIVDNYLDDSDVVTIRRVIPAPEPTTSFVDATGLATQSAMIRSAKWGGLL